MVKTKFVAAILIAAFAAAFLIWLTTKRPAPPLPVAEVPLAPTSAPTQGSAPSSTAATSLQSQQSEPVMKRTTNTSTKDSSGIDLAVGTNAIFLIEGPDGRHTGKDPATNRVLQEIPQSAYLEDRIDNAVTGEVGTEISHQIQISQPMQGAYHLVLTGLQQGAFELVVRTFSKDGGGQPPIYDRGDITSGSQIRFELEFTSAAGGISTLKRLPH